MDPVDCGMRARRDHAESQVRGNRQPIAAAETTSGDLVEKGWFSSSAAPEKERGKEGKRGGKEEDVGQGQTDRLRVGPPEPVA